MRGKYYLGGLSLIAICLTCITCNAQSVENIQLAEQYFEALNNKNLALCDSIVTADFTKSSNGRIENGTGPEVLKNAIKNHSKNNSEYQYTVEDIFASDRRVGVRWRWKSINIKTGEPKPINITAMSIFEISDSKISRLWQAFDMAAFNGQLTKTE